MKKHIETLAVAMVTVEREQNMERIEIVDHPTFHKLREMIDCRTAEFVYLPEDNIMIIDEEGLLNDKPLNMYASYLAGIPIVGDALIVKRERLDQIPYK